MHTLYSTQVMHILPLLLLATSPIQIDGSFNDWAAGITSQEDNNYVYKLIEFPEPKCLQQLPEQLVVDVGRYTIFFSPDGKGYGISCKEDDTWISPYDADIVFAPTTESTKFEIRVRKDDTKSTLHSFSLSRKGEFRVVSWNVHFGNLLKDKERAARILKALQPDVLLIQELDGEDSSGSLGKFLLKTLGGSWTVGVSPMTGTLPHQKLQSAIATRLNQTRCSILPLSFNNEQPLKAVITGFKTTGEPITFVSLHLRCCGGPTGEAEAQRQREATRIRSVLDTVTSSAFIIGGDWNLVGTTKPIEIVQSNELAIVEAYQPDGVTNATWSDKTSSFTPGRLDWILYSPETLEVAHCFVLDTSDLDSETCAAYDLLPEDTEELSDHLPLVADFNIRK